MTNADMSKLETLMRTLFPSAHMFSDVAWDYDCGCYQHYLDMNNKIECTICDNGNVDITVTDTHNHTVKYSEIVSGDWREIMDKIMSVAEHVGVQSVFYQ